MFFQILFTSMNMCTTAIFIILFTNDIFTLLYYIVYFLSMTGEVLPFCYYASMIELEFENLTYALFSSNWMEQNRTFKKNLRIFAEVTKKPMYMEAWIIHINLNSFIFACKNAYSLFALVMNMK